MSRTHDAAAVIRALDPFWRDIRHGAPHAQRNLLELQAVGYPSTTTPASGSPGGGTGTSAGLERHIMDADGNLTTVDDMASRDLATMRALLDRLAPGLQQLHRLVLKWNYVTDGEELDGRKARSTAPTEHKTNELRWCASCLTDKGHCEPATRKHRPKDHPADEQPIPYCEWCYKFVLAQGIEPPVALLRARHRGERISTDAVKRALAGARKPAVHRAGDKPTVDNLHPTRPSPRRRGPDAVIPEPARRTQ